MRHFTILVVLTLVACGGGGGGGGPNPPVPPTPPTSPAPPEEPGIVFTRELEAGLRRAFGSDPSNDFELASGGVAASDYDGDGDVDLLLVGGNAEPNHLYANRGDGTFVEMAAEVGLDIVNWGSGPAFGDIDADGDLDLFIGAIDGAVFLFENRLDEADASFVDITAASGIILNSYGAMSATFFDYDQDGFLDLFLTHWGTRRRPGEDTETVWRNNGDRTFESRSVETGIAEGLMEDHTDWSFTANFSDIDGDGDGDLLMSSDYETSQVLLNNGDGTFSNVTDREVIVDQAGMGGAVGDFDNDGDMDWFVTSIYNLDAGEGGLLFGNRLYRNDGDGVFTDVSDDSGTRDGAWGWGACAADFDNDTRIDLAHVNGWRGYFRNDRSDRQKDYTDDQVRLFRNVGEPGIRFEEHAEQSGINNRSQGRGIACFDADRDGDIDIVISNTAADNVVYYRNDTATTNHYLAINLDAAGSNKLGVGAHITLTTDDGVTQVRELGGTNHYVSHGPFEVHFGMGSATRADVTVRWPGGGTTVLTAVDADQLLTIRQEPSAGGTSPTADAPGSGGLPPVAGSVLPRE